MLKAMKIHWARETPGTWRSVSNESHVRFRLGNLLGVPDFPADWISITTHQRPAPKCAAR